VRFCVIFAPQNTSIEMAKKRITKATYLKWYEDMLFWRKFEDMAAALYIQQKSVASSTYTTVKKLS